MIEGIRSKKFQLSSSIQKRFTIAAFDTINRTWFFKILRLRLGDHNNFNANLKVLEAIYSTTFAHIAEDDPELAFQILAGVRQGGPESPSLFCLLMDWVMRIFESRAKEMKDEKGEPDPLYGFNFKYSIPGSATNRIERAERDIAGDLDLLWAGFADDVALFFSNERCRKYE